MSAKSRSRLRAMCSWTSYATRRRARPSTAESLSEARPPYATVIHTVSTFAEGHGESRGYAHEEDRPVHGPHGLSSSTLTSTTAGQPPQPPWGSATT